MGPLSMYVGKGPKIRRLVFLTSAIRILISVYVYYCIMKLFGNGATCITSLVSSRTLYIPLKTHKTHYIQTHEVFKTSASFSGEHLGKKQ